MVDLATAYVRIVPSLAGAEKEIAKQLGGSKVRRAGEEGGRTLGGAVIGGLKTVGKIAGGAAVAGIGLVAGAAITKGFDRALQLQDAEAKLTGLGHSGESVAKIMESALAAVKGTAFGMGDAATVAASTVAAGVKPGRDLERTLTLIGDAATIAGTDMSDMGAVFNKVAASNKLQMDSINQLHDAGIPALALVADELGVTAEEASKMASAGEIDFATFQKAMESGLGGAAQESGKTFRGAMANMGAALGRLGVGFADPLVAGAPVLFTAITGALDSVNEIIAPVADGFAARLTPALENAAGAVDKIAPAIVGLRDLVTTGDFSADIRRALGVTEDDPLVRRVLDLRDGVAALSGAFRDGGTVVSSSGLAGYMETLGLVVRNLWDAIGPTVATLAPAVWELVQAFSPLGLVFQVLAPVLPSLAQSLSEIVVALAGALAGAAPALASVATALSMIVVGAVELVAPLLENETLVKSVVLAFIGWKVIAGIVAGVRGALALYRAVQLGVVAVTYGASGAMVVAGASAKVYGIGMKAVAIAQRAAAIAQWAFNAAMTANPIGLVIAGIAALVAGLVWFFTKTEVGQKIIKTVWGAIQSAISGVVSWFQDTAMPVIEKVWGAIVRFGEAAWTVMKIMFVAWATAWTLLWKGIEWVWSKTGAVVFEAIKKAGAAVWEWLSKKVFTPIRDRFEDMALGLKIIKDKVVVPVWNGIKDAASAVWEWLRDRVLKPIRDQFEVMALGMRIIKNRVIVPVWNAIKDAGAAMWKWLREKVFNPIRDHFQLLGDIFRFVVNSYIKPAWKNIRDSASNAWKWVKDRVFSPMKEGVRAVGDTFDTVRKVIKTAWDKIKAAAAGPVNFVIETVYMKGIRKTWNDIADSVGLDLKLPSVSSIRFASGGVLPGYTPGRDVHEFYSPTGGRLSLSGGEAIMRPEFTRAVGGPAGVAALNAKARSGQAFKNGGVFGDVWDKIKNVTADFLSGPAALIKKAITGPMNSLLGGIGGGSVGQVAAALPRRIVEGLADKAKALIGEMFAGSGTGGGRFSGPALGWQNMWAILRNVFPGATLTSAYRPGAITAVGTPSFHGQGRAIDVTPSMEIFNWIAKAFPNSSELIYSPAGGRQLYMGRKMQFGEPTRGDHWDHVHWAMRNGGVVPALYDNGGWLPSGGLGINATGKPEAVLTPDESRALKAGLNRAPRTLVFNTTRVSPRDVVHALDLSDLHDVGAPA